MTILYLDTNHISRLAKHPADAACRSLMTLLRSKDYSLAFTLFHLYELSAPEFASRESVGTILDSVTLAWAIRLDQLHDLETESALAEVLTGIESPFRVFWPDPAFAWDMPAAASIRPSQMLKVWSESEGIRGVLRGLGQRGATLQQLYSTAAKVVTEPETPLLARIRARPPRSTKSGLHLPVPYPERELLEKAGGLAGFPSYNTFTLLARTRYADTGFPADPNHILDDLHACYSPYVSFSALDRTTAGRCRTAQLPQAPEVTYRLEDLVAATSERAS